MIEVLSPSNTKVEIREKATLCLATGAEEFWIVDPKQKSVTVTRRKGGTLLYEMGGQIPLTWFEGALEVSAIFS